MKIAAVVLAAGLSRRMGSSKMLLRWGETTVLACVLQTLDEAGIADRKVVLGSDRPQVEAICWQEGAVPVFNPDYEAGEMLSSLQVGLQSIAQGTEAALVVLGDQPGMQAETIKAIVGLSTHSLAPLIVPSFQNRRGHPWLVRHSLWSQILTLRSPETPRDFLRSNAASIQYAECDSDSILRDIDTPEEYLRSRP